ncbi:MAG: MATE family efflux transporter [Oscillospiraceae bacterium]|nr:MATE family efflux transporter [Oscillospiraceae bacterium]
MERENRFTSGPILAPLVRFTLPVLLALFLQALYGAIDLWVVGRFALAADVSGVSTGSQITQSVAIVITGLAMGITVQVGQKIGEGRPAEAGRAIGSGITLFCLLALVVTAVMAPGAGAISRLMQAPAEAMRETTAYVRICAAGTVFIVAYNVLGSVFRGIGNSRIPLYTVGIASIFNVAGDLLFVAVLHMGAAGAAIATVMAQALSVLLSLLMIRRIKLPFTLTRAHLHMDRAIVGRILGLGAPIALQDLLVSVSFLVIMAIVNTRGVIASAGVGVAEKVCAFIMLVPSSYEQAMSAFVAQNVGAGEHRRARLALRYSVLMSASVGVLMFWAAFFHGDALSWIFAKDQRIVAAGADYLRAYGIDCLLTCFLFCFIGFYNGYGRTVLVMAQGIFGAFAVRIPVAYFMSRQLSATLFHIGLATPCSTVTQILICLIALIVLRRKLGERQQGDSLL